MQDAGREDGEEFFDERLEELRDEQRHLENDLGERVIGLKGYRGEPG